MAHAKHVSKVKRSGNAVKVLGIAGASLAASASGSTALIMIDTSPFDVGNPDQGYTLNDEEISDVSLATFHFFNEEALGTLPSGIQLARGCGHGGKWSAGAGRLRVLSGGGLHHTFQTRQRDLVLHQGAQRSRSEDRQAPRPAALHRYPVDRCWG